MCWPPSLICPPITNAYLLSISLYQMPNCPFAFFLKGKEVRKEERASQRPQCRNANSALDDENEQNDWCVCVSDLPIHSL